MGGWQGPLCGTGAHVGVLGAGATFASLPFRNRSSSLHRANASNHSSLTPWLDAIPSARLSFLLAQQRRLGPQFRALTPLSGPIRGVQSEW